MEKSATAFAPATLANVGAGFDCFGLALDGPEDRVRVTLAPQAGLRITQVTGVDAARIPYDADKNTAARAARSIWERRPALAARYGLEMEIVKGIPAGSGLGSSAASAAAGATAAAALVKILGEQPLDDDALFEAALDGEELASGDRHGDNVAPALFGGFTIVHSASPPAIARFMPALPLHVALVLPNMSISTKTAREILPREVPLQDAKANWAATALMVYALLQGDASLVGRAMTDRIVEPRRAALIPGFQAMKEAALAAGAYGFTIGGSGPACFALCGGEACAAAAGEAALAALRRAGLDGVNRIGRISEQGARVPP
ncbi:MAG: homoserine kinase [Myxococcales bacterium]|nr:MAG: homoserine kinase [Myxococcales bacterium]